MAAVSMSSWVTDGQSVFGQRVRASRGDAVATGIVRPGKILATTANKPLVVRLRRQTRDEGRRSPGEPTTVVTVVPTMDEAADKARSSERLRQTITMSIFLTADSKVIVQWHHCCDIMVHTAAC